MKPITHLPISCIATVLRWNRCTCSATSRSLKWVLTSNVHLKSAGKRPWNTLSPLVVRTAEALVLAKVLNRLQERNPDCELLVMGDFNDSPTSTAFTALDQLQHGVLYDPLMRELVPANPRISTYWPKRRTRIDRILLNNRAKRHYAAGSIRLWGNKRAEIASDHFPLSIDMLPSDTPQDHSGYTRYLAATASDRL